MQDKQVIENYVGNGMPSARISYTKFAKRAKRGEMQMQMMEGNQVDF